MPASKTAHKSPARKPAAKHAQHEGPLKHVEPKADHAELEPEKVAELKEQAKAEAQVKAQSPHVVLDLKTRRSGDEPVQGSWVDVVSGKHKGLFGSFEGVSEYAKDGYPSVVFFRTRDADNQLLEVPLKDLRPSDRNGGR